MKSKKQGNVFGSVGKQFGGIVNSTVRRVAREPMEVLKTAVGVRGSVDAKAMVDEGENQAMEAMEQAVATQQSNQAGGQIGDQGAQPPQPKGFRTQEDFDKYTQKSGNKDEMELRMMRRKLEKEWGVGEGIEAGMEKVRQERDQKDQEKDQVEEQEKQQVEAMKYEKEKQENEQVKAAKEGASAEKRGKMG